MLKAQGSPFFPKVYRTGENFIIMEYIPGVTLEAYLKIEKALPRKIIKQLLRIFEEIEHFGINNRDVSLNNVMVAENGTVKRIDLVGAMRIRSKPEKLFDGLQKAGFLDTFLEQVKEIDKEKYEQWKKLI